MAVSSIKDFWIHPNALTITLNYFGDPQLIQTSMLAGAVIMAYRKDVISYDAAHNFRVWKLQAFPTQLNDTSTYYVHAELSRSGDTAMIIYSPVKRDIEGRSYIDGSWNNTTSTESYFIYLGTISASVDNDGSTVERAWTDGFYTGTLDTDQQRMEEASGEWKTMFNYNAVTGQIEPLKPFSKIKVMGEAIFQSIAQFVNGLVIGKRTITDVAVSSDSGNESKVSDATLPTTGYVQKEIEALDDHFLIKDGDDPQEVGGEVSFGDNVSVGGDHSVGGNQTINGELNIPKNGTDDGEDPAVVIGDFFEQGDIIQGAKITKDGMASFAGIKSPSMQIYELNYNRKTAVQGEYVFSDGETIEKVEYITTEGAAIDSSVYNGEEYDYILLTVRTPYAGYITTFKPEDILYSNVNMIGESGTCAKTGKCWMYVLSESEEAINGNTIKARLYAPSDCPSGNIAPQPHMTISRHGNKTDKSRQDLFIISSENSNMVMLRGVNYPIIAKEGMYGVVVGKLPESLLKYVKDTASYVSDTDPYVYARGVIVQDLIMLDYQGKPIATERYRGDWNPAIANGLVVGEDVYRSSSSLIDTVTHNGSLWRCMVNGTPVPPSEGAEWHKKVSKGDDSTAVVYQLKPSANVVYYRTAENKLSVDNLEVVVGVTDNDGYYEIADQYTLEQRGLAVYYVVDGEGEPTLLNISPDGQFVLEDGSGLIIAETGNELLLEGDSLDISAIKDNITLYLKDIDTNDDRATYIIPVIKDGEEGKQGRMLYPAGEWDATKKYAIENNSAPFVRYQKDENSKPTFYVLVWEGDAIQGKIPSGEGNDIYWRPFTYMNYLFAEFLMARWAQFGGEEGGVFYDRWLFSQYGLDEEGNEVHYAEKKGDIFDDNSDMSKGFSPHLAIDFKNGAIETDNLTERYHRYQNVGIVKMEKYHNIIVQPESGVSPMLSESVQGFSGPLVILPQKESKLARNGSAVSIFADMGDTFRLFAEKEKEKWTNIPLSGLYKLYSTFSLICADDIIGDESKPGYATEPGGQGQYAGNWIICHGCRSKWLVLGAGDMVSMRLVISGDTRYWVVTNSSDIATIEGDIYLNKDLHWKTDEIGSSVTFKESVFNEATGYYEGFDQIAFTNASAQNENWNNVGTHTDAKYIRMLFASKNFISKYAYVYMGYNFPHIILSTHKDGWWSDEGNNYHYRLLDGVKDEEFPLTKDFPLTKEEE